mgnify:FL=1
MFKLRIIGNKRVIYIVFILLLLDFGFQVYHNLVEYKNYPITIFERKFGYYDPKTKYQILRGNIDDAIQFFEIITNNEEGWEEIKRNVNEIIKFNKKNEIYCKIKYSINGEDNTIITIYSKYKKRYPFASNQIILFKNEVKSD